MRTGGRNENRAARSYGGESSGASLFVPVEEPKSGQLGFGIKMSSGLAAGGDKGDEIRPTAPARTKAVTGQTGTHIAHQVRQGYTKMYLH